MDDDVFDLDMVFDFDASDVIIAMTSELGSPMNAGRFSIWKGDGYDIKIKDGNLDVYINRNQVSMSTTKHLENILADLFENLDLDIEISN